MTSKPFVRAKTPRILVSSPVYRARFFYSPKAFRLTPDVIHSTVPPSRIGSYVLIKDGAVRYVGRSDVDVQRRLIAHYAVARADYFRFQLHTTVEQAYVAECAAYHALKPQLTNFAHPDLPAGVSVACAFCSSGIRAIMEARRLARRVYVSNPTFIKNLRKDGHNR